ncbi:MAG TPA: hypothetical protein VFA22_07825 [Stellaceae bacterium]|nr:hypothetical protein [Stellaceae bacterium]
MEDFDMSVSTRQEWREKNRGLLIALSACLAIWAFAIWMVVGR